VEEGASASGWLAPPSGRSRRSGVAMALSCSRPYPPLVSFVRQGMIWREKGGKGVSIKNQCNLDVVVGGRKCKTGVVVELKMKSCECAQHAHCSVVRILYVPPFHSSSARQGAGRAPRPVFQLPALQAVPVSRHTSSRPLASRLLVASPPRPPE
jgi:hypothetical protein